MSRKSSRLPFEDVTGPKVRKEMKDVVRGREKETSNTHSSRFPQAKSKISASRAHMESSVLCPRHQSYRRFAISRPAISMFPLHSFTSLAFFAKGFFFVLFPYLIRYPPVRLKEGLFAALLE